MATMRNLTRLTLLAATALLVTGCGDSTEPEGAATTPAAPAIRNADPWTEQQIIDAAGLIENEGGISYHTRTCDQIAVILTSKQAVDTYAGAGDTVVTNPDGTAGVKVVGAEAACLAELERGLAKLR